MVMDSCVGLLVSAAMNLFASRAFSVYSVSVKQVSRHRITSTHCVSTSLPRELRRSPSATARPPHHSSRGFSCLCPKTPSGSVALLEEGWKAKPGRQARAARTRISLEPHASPSLVATEKDAPLGSFTLDSQKRRSANFLSVCWSGGSTIPGGNSVSKAIGRTRAKMRRMLLTAVYSLMTGFRATNSRRCTSFRMRLAMLTGCCQRNARPSAIVMAWHTSSKDTAELPGRTTMRQNASSSSLTGIWINFWIAMRSSVAGLPSLATGCTRPSGGLPASAALGPITRAVEVDAGGGAGSRLSILVSWNSRTFAASNIWGSMLETKMLFHAHRVIKSLTLSKELYSLGSKGSQSGILLMRTRCKNCRSSCSV
mmetsp:Transcript_83193/g.138777  ORF Transcript_83193/g.138777 Transcript_83193/m.138777 type:complete len:369 (+) Transcript_83193:3305-4411(+)